MTPAAAAPKGTRASLTLPPRDFMMERNTWSRIRTPLTALAVAGALATVSAAPQTAKADHPVAAAGIAAIGAIGAATIGAVAVIGAAAIGAAATIKAAEISAEGNNGGGDELGGGDGEGGDGGDGGGGDANGGGDGRSAGLPVGLMGPAKGKHGCVPTLAGRQLKGPGKVMVDAVPKNFRAFIERSFGAEITSHKGKGVVAKAEFNFDGDVMKSPNKCAFVGDNEKITWKLKLEKNPTSKSNYFILFVDHLDLTTTAVPKTEGHSEMRFTAYQHGKEIWSWNAVAHQGRKSLHGPLPKGTTVTKTKGELHIDNFWAKVPFTLAKGKTEANVEVVVEYLGKGERL